MKEILSTSKKRPVLQWMKPKDLGKHPRNWRLHSESQKVAVREFIKEVGWAGVLLYNKTTKRLLDGHLRHGISDQNEEVPVLVGEWSEDQELKILAALDPLGAMATQDDKMFRELADLVNFDSHDLTMMVEERINQKGEAPGMKGAASDKDMAVKLQLRPQEHYDYVIVLAQTYEEWATLCDLLGLELKPRGVSKMGFGRGVRAQALINRLKGIK